MTMRDAREARELLIRARKFLLTTETVLRRDDAFEQFFLVDYITKFLNATEPKKKGESK